MTKLLVASEATDLRRGVDYVGVCVAFIIHDGKGRILLQKHSQNCRDEQGKWDIGGGAVEFGEPMTEAVKREIKEEYNTEALEITYLLTYEALREHEGTPTNWIALIHSVLVDPERVRIAEPHKVDELGWFTSDNLPDLLHSQFWKSYQPALDKGIVR